MTSSARAAPAFEWWMLSNLAVGAGFAAFVVLLIPPYVTEVTGSAAEAGVVMAAISLAAVTGPVLGSFADRYDAHRIVLSGGVAGMAVAFLAYALSADSGAVLALDAILMGVAIAAQQAVAPVLVVAAGLPADLQARRLTILNVAYPAGQVLGGVLLGAAAAAGWGFSERFWLAAGFMGIAAILTWFTSGRAAGRVREVAAARLEGAADPAVAAGAGGAADVARARRTGLGALLLSSFGLFLVIVILSSVANNGINAQIANILPNVYGFDAATTSALISLAGLVNLPLFVVFGAWMARSGPLATFAVGTVLRLAGAIGMAVAGALSGAPALLAAASMLLLYQGTPASRLAQPVVGIRLAAVAAGAASGWVLAASAIGSFVGSLGGGFLAESVGFNAINWMASAAAAGAVVLLLVVLAPQARRRLAAG